MNFEHKIRSDIIRLTEMSPWQRKLRRAFGSVKDQTAIGLAKVASTMAPELEVAIVKATSHYEAAMEEKHVQEVIYLTSTCRAYTMACVSLLSRRLGRTHNWIVVIKTLTLIHRLLRDGDPSFGEELFYESQAGSRMLNLSGFRDDSVSNGWDYSAFVRSYALFLDELLDYDSSKQGFTMEDGRPSGSSSSSTSKRSGSEAYGSTNDEQVVQNTRNLVFREMKPCELLERMPPLQKLLERVLNCHPAGIIKVNRLVQFALELVIRDSFQFYGNISDGLAILLDAFFEMESADCIKAFEIQIVAAKQAEALNIFYGFCKTIGVCHASDYPFVPKIPEKLLEAMEDFLKDCFIKGVSDEQESSQSLPHTRGEKEAAAAGPCSSNSNVIKPLPAPPDRQAMLSRMQGSHVQDAPTKARLLDLNDVTSTVESQRARLHDIALLSDTDSCSGQQWQDSGKRDTSRVDFRNLGEERSAAGWELALFASPPHTPEPSSFALAGGLNHSLVDRFHEQALCQQRMAIRTPFCSTSGMALPGETTSLLALPAPETPAREDPFVASTSIPPPPYVQMSDMKQKQELLHQQQLLWMQCQKNGTRNHDGGFTNLMQTYHTNPDLY